LGKDWVTGFTIYDLRLTIDDFIARWVGRAVLGAPRMWSSVLSPRAARTG
jgi:hypothetical protein